VNDSERYVVMSRYICSAFTIAHYRSAAVCGNTLLLINGIDVTILWAGLAKRSKEISCSRNLVAAGDFYDARRTFYASSYENLVKKVRDTPLIAVNDAAPERVP